MKPSLRFVTCFAALALGLTACSQSPETNPAGAGENAALSEGDWAVDPAGSHLAYVSIKSGEIAETNRFEKLAGMVSSDGAARIEIDLASVNTGVEIRDTRMRDIFFEVTDYPSAVVTAQLDPASFTSLEVGDVKVQPLAAKVALKGMEADVEGEVQVARISENRVLAATTRPILITTDMFGLTDELGELRALAQLPSISPAVPVTFTLTFRR